MSTLTIVSRSSQALPAHVRGEPALSPCKTITRRTWLTAVLFSTLALVALRLLIVQTTPEPIESSTRDAIPQPTAERPKTWINSQEIPRHTVLSALAALEQESNSDLKQQLFAREVESIGIDNTRVALEQLLLVSTPDAVELRDRLVRRWAEVDPAQAAEWSAGLGEGGPHGAVMTQVAITWANSDVEAAARWVSSLPMNQATAEATIALSYEAARTRPLLALETAGHLDPSPQRDESLAFALSQWVASDFAAARDWTLSMPPSDLRQRLVAAVSTSAPNGQAAAELAAIQLDPGDAQDRAAVSIVQQWAQTSPEAAAAWVEQFEDGALRTSAAENLAAIWTVENPETAGHWIESLPQGSLRDAAIRGAEQIGLAGLFP
jgi:hypothetical protein